jgi:hypothetical protein
LRGFGLSYLKDWAPPDRDPHVVINLLVLLGKLVGKLFKKGLIREGSRVAIKTCLYAQGVFNDLFIVSFLFLLFFGI